jgi:KaiC/GvpD/RAD55 family RecA-like ATPase
MLEKITTGSEGLDGIMNGGIPKGNQVILAGGPGAGKTLLCMECLYKNAKKGIPGAFISLEETKGQILQNMKEAFEDFSDIDKVMASGTVKIYDIEALSTSMQGIYVATGTRENKMSSLGSHATGIREGTINNFFRNLDGNLTNLLKGQKVELIAIDNVTVLRNLIKDTYEYRNFVTDMAQTLKNKSMTSLIVTELSDPREDRVVFDMEFFAFDGIIAMYYAFGIGKKMPTMEVIKMRGTDHSNISVPYKITSSGIKLLDLELKPE